MINLRSGPILAALIHSLYRLPLILVSPSARECYFQSETKIEPDLRLYYYVIFSFTSIITGHA